MNNKKALEPFTGAWLATVVRWFLRCVSVAALVSGLPSAWAQTDQPAVIELNDQVSSLSLDDRSQFWVDASGRASVGEVDRPATPLPWALRPQGHRLKIPAGGALWIRFRARDSDWRHDWELELARAAVDSVQLYSPSSAGGWSVQSAGDAVPVSRWPSPDRYPVMQILGAGEGPNTYYVRIEHERVPFSGELIIHGHGHLRQQRMLQDFLIGAYFGLAALLTSVAVANAMVFRDSSFGAYAIYVALLALLQAASLGIGGQFLWPDSVFLNERAEWVLLPTAAVAGLLFIRHVVQPRRIGRWLDHAAIAMSALWLILTVVDQIHGNDTSFQIITVTGTVTLGLAYAMLWTAWKTGDRWVRWIALGILPVLLSSSLPIFRNFGLLSAGFLSSYGMVLAATIEAPILFYGLLQRSSLQHEAQARAKALDVTEPLTGLSNRHSFMQRLHDSLVRAQRYRHRCALLLIQLDNHDFFLREHGREVADRALVLTGSLLRSVARDVDTASRVDDGAFALLMEVPVRGPQAVAAATGLVAGGLRPSDELPVGSTLKLRIVLALLPQDSLDLQFNAQAHLDWMQIAMDELRRDPRRSIQSLNF